MIEDWKCHHEIGHGLIGHIFHGYTYTFNGVTFDPEEVRSVNRNPHDQGYTKLKNVANFMDLYRADPHTVALVDALMILAGSAEATFLSSDKDHSEVILLPSQLSTQIDFRGADGDFENINQGLGESYPKNCPD
jgi:hypothetical protein